MDCIFCKIINGEIPSKKVFENEFVFAFYDIVPQAPFHILIVPKAHISSATDINTLNSKAVANVFEAAALIAKENSLTNGFRLVTNSGEDACQSVPHIHFHMLAGRKLLANMG